VRGQRRPSASSGQRLETPDAERTRWGWHRLQPEWATRIVAAAEIRPGELVVDVGAGRGALTAPLLESGARVIAVELHERRAHELRERFADDDRVVVLTMDCRDFRWPSRPVRVVANPPFGLLAALLSDLLASQHVTAADLVLPRAAVARYTRRLPRSRRLRARRGINLPRSAFRPRPPLDCGVLQLRPGA
jgi:23S rRNA (adenine-N6)-dimethyltransferase